MRNRVKQFLFVVFFLPLSIYGQRLSGVVVDEQTQAKIPFASISVFQTTTGTMADIDGKFAMDLPHFPVNIQVRCLGYKDTLITISEIKNTVIYLQPQATQLKEAVIIAGENPAHKIIKNAVQHRDLNNPEKQTAFTFTTYSKMAFGPDVTSEDVFEETNLNTDTSVTKIHEALKSHYLFFTETVTKRQFLPPAHTQELVVANRISGLKTPQFSLMSSALQPFSFYSDFVQILGVDYLSPVAKNSYKDYVFDMEDTLFVNSDSIFIISFQPKNGKTFKGLKGVLHIHSNGYALQNIQVTQADPESNVQIHIEQMSERIADKQWFPIQFNSHLIFHVNADTQNEGSPLNTINARGKTYVKDINLNPQLTPKDFGNVILDTETDAHKKDSAYWSTHRNVPLTGKEAKTYQVIDSIGNAEKFDTKIKVVEAFATGEIPVGYVSFPLKRFFDFNQYEGTRLGVGLKTSEKFSEHFSLGGYTAYGFNDKEWKFGSNLSMCISKKNDVYIGGEYVRDVVTSGEAQFIKPLPFELRTYSEIYVAQKDKIEGVQGYVKFRLFKDLQNEVFFNSYSQSYRYNYQFVSEHITLAPNAQAFQRAEVGYAFRFGFREKYVRSFGKNISLGTKYPYVWGRIVHGNTALGGTFTYTQLDVKVAKWYRIKGLGKLGFMVQAGMVNGNVPASLLHYGRGMRYDNLSLYIENAFNTMRANEFLSSEYVSVHVHHQFNPFFKTKYVAPQLSVVQALAWGNLAHPESHLRQPISTLEKGFLESGVLFDQLLVLNTSGFGAGVFYRYGPNALPNFQDNWAYKFTFIYVL